MGSETTRRMVITAVCSGMSQTEAARTYGVSQSWVSRLMARYRLEGQAAYTPRSTRPHASPNQASPQIIDRIVQLREELTGQGLDAGAKPSAGTWNKNDCPVHAPPFTGSWSDPDKSNPSQPNDPKRPTSVSRPSGPTSAGSPTSPTTDWPTAQIPRSSHGWMATPATACTCQPAPASAPLSSHRPSPPPRNSTAGQHLPSPTTAWYTQPDWPGRAVAQAAPSWRTCSNTTTSARRTDHPTTPKPKAKSNDSSRP